VTILSNFTVQDLDAHFDETYAAVNATLDAVAEIRAPLQMAKRAVKIYELTKRNADLIEDTLSPLIRLFKTVEAFGVGKLQIKAARQTIESLQSLGETISDVLDDGYETYIKPANKLIKSVDKKLKYFERLIAEEKAELDTIRYSLDDARRSLDIFEDLKAKGGSGAEYDALDQLIADVNGEILFLQTSYLSVVSTIVQIKNEVTGVALSVNQTADAVQAGVDQFEGVAGFINQIEEITDPIRAILAPIAVLVDNDVAEEISKLLDKFNPLVLITDLIESAVPQLSDLQDAIQARINSYVNEMLGQVTSVFDDLSSMLDIGGKLDSIYANALSAKALIEGLTANLPYGYGDIQAARYGQNLLVSHDTYVISVSIPLTGVSFTSSPEHGFDITGNELDNLLSGGRGNDRISGGAGNDFMIGGLGDDTIDGGSGDFDTVAFTGKLTDYRIAATDTDVRVTHVPRYNAFEQTGTDIVTNVEYFMFEDRLVDLGFLKNLVYGLPDESKVLQTAAGVVGEDRNETVIAAGDWKWALYGLDGNDLLLGGVRGDELHGGDGDDVLRGGEGNYEDIFDGGTGEDTVDYSDRLDVSQTYQPPAHYNYGGIKASLMAAQYSAFYPDAYYNYKNSHYHEDSFLNVENLSGSRFTDFLVGDDNDNKLSGVGGFDILIGNGGNDILDGGVGQVSSADDQVALGNVLVGGDGDDRAYSGFSPTPGLTADTLLYTRDIIVGGRGYDIYGASRPESNWDGGQLSVRTASGGEVGDRLRIGSEYQYGIYADGLSLYARIGPDTDGGGASAVAIGSLSHAGGTISGNETLLITFNDQATNQIAQAVLRSLQFSATPATGTVGLREIELLLDDAQTLDQSTRLLTTHWVVEVNSTTTGVPGAGGITLRYHPDDGFAHINPTASVVVPGGDLTKTASVVWYGGVAQETDLFDGYATDPDKADADWSIQEIIRNLAPSHSTWDPDFKNEVADIGLPDLVVVHGDTETVEKYYRDADGIPVRDGIDQLINIGEVIGTTGVDAFLGANRTERYSGGNNADLFYDGGINTADSIARTIVANGSELLEDGRVIATYSGASVTDGLATTLALDLTGEASGAACLTSAPMGQI